MIIHCSFEFSLNYNEGNSIIWYIVWGNTRSYVLIMMSGLILNIIWSYVLGIMSDLILTIIWSMDCTIVWTVTLCISSLDYSQGFNLNYSIKNGQGYSLHYTLLLIIIRAIISHRSPLSSLNYNKNHFQKHSL